MAEELKDSGIVTTLSVIGFVFGLVGMLGSFIPCIGAIAFYIVDPENKFNILISLSISGHLWYILLQGKPEKRGETLQYETEEKA
jgi:hypothetical protein